MFVLVYNNAKSAGSFVLIMKCIQCLSHIFFFCISQILQVIAENYDPLNFNALSVMLTAWVAISTEALVFSSVWWCQHAHMVLSEFLRTQNVFTMLITVNHLCATPQIPSAANLLSRISRPIVSNVFVRSKKMPVRIFWWGMVSYILSTTLIIGKLVESFLWNQKW